MAGPHCPQKQEPPYMSRHPTQWTLIKIPAAFTLLAALLIAPSCGNQIDAGRNGDPSRFPVTKGQKESESNPKDPANPGPSDNQPINCFQKTTTEIPAGLTKLCAEVIKPEAGFKDLYPILCEQSQLIAVINQPSCGWDGKENTMQRFIHHYSMSTDPTKDYEDVHATILHTPITVDKFMSSVRLAFENFDEFKRQGFQWIDGTKQQKNLTGKTWEQGVEYRFRADKGQYEIGYQGINKLYQISPLLFVHLNRATGDYARVAEFSQIALYQQQADNSTLTIKLEHRRISSEGLYSIAKKSSAELVTDFMKKGYNNAVKP
jgi:hypothetical protein